MNSKEDLERELQGIFFKYKTLSEQKRLTFNLDRILEIAEPLEDSAIDAINSGAVVKERLKKIALLKSLDGIVKQVKREPDKVASAIYILRYISNILADYIEVREINASDQTK